MRPVDMKKLRSQARALEPLLRIGKNGITPTVVAQISLLLDKRGLVKVKLLQSFVEENDKRESAVKLAQGTGAVLVDQVGSMVVLYKDKKKSKEDDV
jgi:RNA-binding protein